MKTLRLLFFLVISLKISIGIGHELEINLKVQDQPESLAFRLYKDATFTNLVNSKEIERTIKDDLTFSGRLNCLSPSEEHRYGIDITLKEDTVRLSLQDRLSYKNPLLTEQITLSGKPLIDRNLLHRLSDSVYGAVIGKPGLATSRILFTYTESSAEQKSTICITDYNGKHTSCVSDKSSLNLTPKFLSRTIKKPEAYLFVSYITGFPKIFLHDLKTGMTQKLIQLRGNQLTPDISLQNDKIVFISDLRGNPDLFLQRFSPEQGPLGNPVQLLNASFGTQGTPCFSPDGTRIAFVANKDGAPKIYIMQIEPKATPPFLLIKKHRESNCPAWSPDGTKIAFCAITKGIRQIYVYDMMTREDSQVTFSSGNKESPSWAPDGEHLVFSGFSGKYFDLYVVNTRTKKSTVITTGPGDKRFPSWEQTFNTSKKRVS